MASVLVKAGQEPDIVCVKAGEQTSITIVDWNAYRGSPIEYVYEITWESELGRPALSGTIQDMPFKIDQEMITMRRQFELEDCSSVRPHSLGCAFTVRIRIDDANVTGLLGFKAHTLDHQFRGKVRVTTLPQLEEIVK